MTLKTAQKIAAILAVIGPIALLAAYITPSVFAVLAFVGVVFTLYLTPFSLIFLIFSLRNLYISLLGMVVGASMLSLVTIQTLSIVICLPTVGHPCRIFDFWFFLWTLPSAALLVLSIVSIFKRK